MPMHPSANQKQRSFSFFSWFLSMTLIASRRYTVISATCGDVHPRGINAYQPSGPHPYFSSSSFSFVCRSPPPPLSLASGVTQPCDPAHTALPNRPWSQQTSAQHFIIPFTNICIHSKCTWNK